MVTYGRWRALKNVVGRDLLWRLGDAAQVVLPGDSSLLSKVELTSFRSSVHGNWFLDNVPAYTVKGRPFMKNTRDPKCPAQPRDLEGARKYVEAIGGDVVFTQIPHSNACRQWVRDIAGHLHKSAVLVDDNGISTMDGGGHLSAEGARIFTERFLRELETTPEFLKLLAGKQALQTPDNR